MIVFSRIEVVMISIRIGGEERKWPGSGDEEWITQRIVRMRRDGQAVCVQITIEQPPIHMVLSAGNCPSGFGGGRPFNEQESDIFELWQKLVLKDDLFGPGQVIAFLKRVAK